MSLTAFLDFWNLIDKADALRGDVVALGMGKGGGVHFDVLPPGGSCGGAVERMLKRYGIAGIWGKRVTRDNVDDPAMAPWWIAFNVRRSQAKWTRYLLIRYGCRVQGRQDAAAIHAVGMPTPWTGGQVASPAPQNTRAKPAPQTRRGLIDRLELP